MFRTLRRSPSRSPRRSTRFSRVECLERRDLLSAGPPQVIGVEVSSSEWSSEFVQFLQSADLGTHGYAIPVGSTAQSASLPWVNLDRVHITFSEDVYINEADLSVSGVNTIAYAFDGFRYDPQSRVATWTLTDAIDADRIMLSLSASGYDPVRDLDNNLLDGEWINNSSTFASGNGTPGGNFKFSLNVLPGDVNNSGANDYDDVISIYYRNGQSTESPAYDPFHDVDGSGLIDSVDWWDEAWSRYQGGYGLPLGTPAGANNNAPTTKGFSLVPITNTVNNVSISLSTRFTDAESGTKGLSYSMVSNSAPELFDLVSLNSSTLVVNAASNVSGRAQIRIRATDPGGLFTEAVVSIDVLYTNQPPVIVAAEFDIQYVAENTWRIVGRVVDPDDDVANLIVEFYGAVRTRSALDDNGQFEFMVSLNPEDWGAGYAITADPHGFVSPLLEFSVGL